ncbi:glycoside hydrolase family 18 protein [Dichomitus squalens LYAD-421 SS1]|uniref:glycoside hydrolase family 18 protein n=1 Tax=Dichomitus squalens (strain LYAD-421) TaxID=732165 RepID=UPI0004414DFF|nr:glycoside hydrolase family 18 protein [Dichomitus squalens LYAD-421 SS1]EJF63602.1 glycoside hydrolase family 18 protein [Dichomitus squalens LYAD-421 SS1]
MWLQLSSWAALAALFSPLPAKATSLARDAPSDSTNSPSAAGTFAGTWYTTWHNGRVPIDNIDWKKYTSVSYAFVTTDPDHMVSLTADDINGTIFKDLVSTAHNQNTKVMMTVGGWTGSKWFSLLLAENYTRSNFINAVGAMANNYAVQGVEFDWEFPNKQGVGCNTIDKDDAANFLLMLQEFRQNPATSSYILSAAVSDKPFLNATGQPMEDMSEFAKVLDYVTIMNYDVWGSVDGILGPNAPLNDSCAPPQYQHGSAESAVDTWTKAGFPADKLVLGVPAYGHSAAVLPNNAYNNSELSIYPLIYNNASQVPGDSWDGKSGTDLCGVPWDYSGVWYWTNLADESLTSSFINANGTPRDGIDYLWDDCSQTPRAYNRSSQVMLSYDDVRSFGQKGTFIQEKGLRGYAIWEAAGATDVLIDAINSNMTGSKRP